ncbi:hypothetical protein HK104_010013, partial [Borealophlyctis nickersoniae]
MKAFTIAFATLALVAGSRAQAVNTNTIVQNVLALNTTSPKGYSLSLLGKLAGGFQDVVATLGGAGPLTLFAPTDEALAKANASNPAAFAEIAGNPDMLKGVLT